MKLPGFKRLLKTDFKQEDQPLVDQLSNSLNIGIESLYQALNKRISISENLQATERDIDVAVNSSGTPLSATFATVDFGSKVRNLMVGKVENLTDSGVFPTAAVFISWTTTTSGIQILNIRGLPTGYTFRVRLVMWG